MPELPEVQTIVDELKKTVKNRRIVDLWTDWSKYRPIRHHVVGKKIIDIERRGKNILFSLSDNHLLLIHQKMSGHLLVGKWKWACPVRSREGSQRVSASNGVKDIWVSIIPGPLLEDRNNQYIRLIFFLDNKKMLALSDLRRFAKILCGPKDVILNLPDIKDLGPEALSLSEKVFIELFKKKKGILKSVLMNQNFIAGIGNIYSDEIVWLAKIHPQKRIEKLTLKNLKDLYRAMIKILLKALKLRGASIDDYRTANGERGRYDLVRYVYQREGKPCQRCGTLIKRIKIGGRSAHFCPKCQV